MADLLWSGARVETNAFIHGVRCTLMHCHWWTRCVSLTL